MDPKKFKNFCDCFEEAFYKLASQAVGMEFIPSKEAPETEGRKIAAIVGVVGKNKGRVQVEISAKLAGKMYDHANGEPAKDEQELCFYLAEFANMIAGKGITVLNNTYKGANLRLTPPAIFVGNNLDITTSKISSASKSFDTENGTAKIVIGFEGV